MADELIKSQTETYTLRNGQDRWARFYLEHKGKIGRITISSDYGCWSAWWQAASPDFKTFMTRIEVDYAADNFGACIGNRVSRQFRAFWEHCWKPFVEQLKAETAKETKNKPENES